MAPVHTWKFLKAICLFLSVITMPSLASQAQGAEGMLSIDLSIDGQRVNRQEGTTKPPSGIIKVWEKKGYSEEGKNDEIQRRIRNGLDVQGYEALGHQMNLWEINCITRESRTVERIEYSVDGRVLGSIAYEMKPTEGWQPISPESFSATMYKIGCPPREKK